MKLLLIDNYDSFTYLLVQYFEELGAEVTVVTDSDDFSSAVKNAPDQICENYDAIVISPGPKRPADAHFSCEVVKSYAGQLPILGVCLGLQIFVEVFGGKVVTGEKPVHGRSSHIHHNGAGLFEGLPEDFRVARYHSLVASEVPEELVVDAWSEDGVVQGLHHQQLPLWAVQFHPESLLTEHGHEILRNFLAQV